MTEKPNTLTPKLRFPEFKDRPTWRRQVLGDLFTERQEGGLTGLPLLSLTDKDGLIPQGETNRRDNSSLDKSKYLRVFPGDVAYNTMRMWEGRSAYVGLEGLVSPAYTVCKPKVGTDGLFFSYYFKTWPLIEQFKRYSQGLVKDTLNLKFEAFSQIPISSPQPAEQRKVAACLTSLDEWIAAEGRKLEALQAHKKGLMQELFPREGATHPRVRFPEFRNGPEWETKRIGDLNPYVTSGSRGWAAYYADHGSLFVRITNLSRESIFLDLTDSQFVNLPPEAREGVRTQLKAHDVLISITADIGIIGYIDANVPSPAYINQHIALVRFDTSRVCGMFVAYFLASHESQRRFRASTDNGTKAGMNLLAVQDMQLALPYQAEQQRIAACLSSLDALIAAQSRKLGGLRAHKKGLMQQLFPSPEGGE